MYVCMLGASYKEYNINEHGRNTKIKLEINKGFANEHNLFFLLTKSTLLRIKYIRIQGLV